MRRLSFVKTNNLLKFTLMRASCRIGRALGVRHRHEWPLHLSELCSRSHDGGAPTRMVVAGGRGIIPTLPDARFRGLLDPRSNGGWLPKVPIRSPRHSVLRPERIVPCGASAVAKASSAMSATKILWGQILLVALVVLIFVWAATEWTAWSLNFQPELGRAWLVAFGWPIYQPPAFFWWWFAYDAYARDIFVEGAYIAAPAALRPSSSPSLISVWRAREAKRVTTYGSARWAETRGARRRPAWA